MNFHSKDTNHEWQQRMDFAIARGETSLSSIFVERAAGSEMWDVEGKRYIDFATGIGVCNTGHTHPKIIDAVTQQVSKFSHTCMLVTPYESVIR